MRIQRHWHAALRQARLGDLGLAHAARAAEPASPVADYFFARCLAEAPDGSEAGQFGQAQALLAGALAAQPANPLFMHAHILALLRDDRPEGRRQAAQLLRKFGLPHDLDLLAQVALAIETQIRPVPPGAPCASLPWPDGLPRPAPSEPDAMERDILSLANAPDPQKWVVPAQVSRDSDAPAAPDCAPEPIVQTPQAAPQEPFPQEPPLPELARQRAITSRDGRRMEKRLTQRQPLAVIELANSLILKGRGGAELHFLAGFAAEDADDPLRARAHLCRAARLEPGLPFVLAALARVYWRLNWNDLALALARGLPVEGPNDYGRHYTLALAHEAQGDRRAALAAMAVALRDFFFDARHAYISRALERWLATQTQAV